MPETPPFQQRSEWVETTLQQLSLDDKIGQLLHPPIPPTMSSEQFEELTAGIQVGGVFFFPGTRDDFQNCAHMIQQRSKVPALIASDLENGAGRMVKDATQFPDLMALAAADDAELARTMGEAAAVEGRALGVHWTFGPVVDINVNAHNPITNTRSFGDDPARITRLSTPLIRAMQDHGLCATAKHFPGDGFDDRDQHIATTINPLTMEQWWNLSGRMFAEARDAGVWSMMIGHVSLPAWDPGEGQHMQEAPPGTLSRPIVTDLLREQMGFDPRAGLKGRAA